MKDLTGLLSIDCPYDERPLGIAWRGLLEGASNIEFLAPGKKWSCEAFCPEKVGA